MTGQGVGSQGAVCWVPTHDADPASPSRRFGGSEAAARLAAPRGTRVGPAFVYRPRHWARAARCAPPGPGPLLRAPSERREVGACCQETPPPPTSWRDAAGKRHPGGAFAHSLPAPRGTVSRPKPLSDRRPSWGADRAKFISFPVASSNLATWPVHVDPSLSFPECRQVLKDAREPLGTLANACPLRWYPRGPVEQLRLC